MEERDSMPVIGITMGDPSSIGPELIIKIFSEKSLGKICRPVVIGDGIVLEKRRRKMKRDNLKLHFIKDMKEALYEDGTVDVFDLGIADPDKITPGRMTAEGGNASFLYVKKVIELAQEGYIDATVTNAISKEAINLAGHHYAGHTEIYAELTGTGDVTMMLVSRNLKVVHVSTHVSLRQACDRVKKDRILKVIRQASDACIALGIASPRIAVAGLNPHSGERGLFGTEEQEDIIPAIEEAGEAGYQVYGPIPPDTVFSKARSGLYDMVVAMYHDQGHIPLKLDGFLFGKEGQDTSVIDGVNITLGLPIIRTSVDHGTAFDLAGKGTASAESLYSAIKYAVDFALYKSGIDDREKG